MKITRKQIRKILAEQIATVTDDAIEDVVMKVLSDEGGAAGVEPIEDALEDLEDDEISLPEEDIEDVIHDVSGVKRHADGDFIDTTQLEVRRLTKNQLKKAVRKQIMKESLEMLRKSRADLLDSQYEQVSEDTRYPYGRNRGDVRRTTVYKRLDGQPVPQTDVDLLQKYDAEQRKAGGAMAALSGVNTTKLSSDGMTISVEYYRHTAG